jgi:mannose-1-phosphate guanylyltransferase
MSESARDGGVAGSVWAFILAGGIGSRFWPVSTPDRPKQLLPLASERPLIVDAVERAGALVPDARVRVLASAPLVEAFRPVLPELPESSYWVEPRAKGTCPVLAWAAGRLVREDPDAVMVSLHADHLIRPLAAFEQTLAAAVRAARRDELLLTVGAEPDRVETGYGYIQPGEPLAAGETHPALRVEAFHEKPDADTAAAYIEGGYLWNTGIFVWKASVFLSELTAHAPEVAEHLPLLDTEGAAAFFDAVPNCVVDRAVMERSRRVGTVRATFTWDDVGSWGALSRTREGDADGNVLVGRAKSVEAADNLVYAESGSVVLFGVHDLVVVRTDDTTLVMPRERAPDLKTLLDKMKGGPP